MFEQIKQPVTDVFQFAIFPNPVFHIARMEYGMQVNLGSTSDAVESVANVTDIHEAMFFHADDEVTRSSFGIWSLRWSPDGKEIIAGTGDSSLYIYDVESQRVSALYISHINVTLPFLFMARLHSFTSKLNCSMPVAAHCTIFVIGIGRRSSYNCSHFMIVVVLCVSLCSYLVTVLHQ